MSQTLRVAIAVIVLIAASMWAVDAARLIFDPNYNLDRLGAILACIATSWWLVENAFRWFKDEQ